MHLKMVRVKYNIGSQADLGKILGLSRSNIANIETGISKLSLKHIEMLANYLNINVSELLDNNIEHKSYNIPNNITNTDELLDMLGVKKVDFEKIEYIQYNDLPCVKGVNKGDVLIL